MKNRLLIPGVLDSTTNFIEHPELVAQRLERFASVVGRENVIAGTDCGFATFAGYLLVDPSITWANPWLKARKSPHTISGNGFLYILEKRLNASK
ncbi:MAG TPA: hypothetical protein VF043_27365 [Ktedonobacteraceae bacterium]